MFEDMSDIDLVKKYKEIDYLAKEASRKKFILYNQHDVRLVKRINDKKKLIELAILVAYVSKSNYEDSFSTMRPWDNIIGNHLRRLNIHVPIAKRGEKSEKFKGAVVKEPLPGFHEWVVSFDLESLYPSIMRQYNISPDTIVEKRFPVRPNDVIHSTENLKTALSFAIDNCLTLTANGTMYKREFKGFIPLLVGEMFERRKAAKKEMLVWEKKGESAKQELERRRAMK